MYKNYREINSKKTILANVGVSQGIIVVLSFILSYVLKSNVTQKLSFLYVIFTTGCGIYLALPSNRNKQRENYKSILLFLKREKNIYKPLY